MGRPPAGTTIPKLKNCQPLQTTVILTRTGPEIPSPIYKLRKNKNALRHRLEVLFGHLIRN